MEAAQSVKNCRILVVEDEFIIALDLSEKLRMLGFRIIGPAQSVDRALSLIETDAPDAALLDENLAGASVEPVAEALRERSIPFAVISGYDQARGDGLALVGAQRLLKPTSTEAIGETLKELLREPGASQSFR